MHTQYELTFKEYFPEWQIDVIIINGISFVSALNSLNCIPFCLLINKSNQFQAFMNRIIMNIFTTDIVIIVGNLGGGYLRNICTYLIIITEVDNFSNKALSHYSFCVKRRCRML